MSTVDGSGEWGRGAFSRRSGLSLKALRLYERSGLLVPRRVADNGYRFYGEGQVAVAERVCALRRAGMPLSMVARVLALPPQEGAGLVRGWWRVQEQVASSRRSMVAQACALLEGGGPGAPDTGGFPVGVERVGECAVACVRVRVGQQDLVEGYLEAEQRLRRVLVHQGAVAGERTWVLYHRMPTPDGPASIEVAVPYTGSARPEAEVALRIEPGGEWWVARVERRDCHHPRIMGAYAALDGAVAQAPGVRGSGVVREVYLRPWESVGEREVYAWVARPVQATVGCRG
ncbi:MerR family transcriptional regulator [Nocardiopsis sp. MG754419]|uniref:MerR family transcriptional regulator n=1 Tax=Nocardiopsis sp. MG754419 TaxID=2259865 RepID=UPI002011DB87|nr:MerR family transcriptional regulator [Nocardiopsis sp. MG754419]